MFNYYVINIKGVSGGFLLVILVEFNKGGFFGNIVEMFLFL